ncbi:ABC transporter [Caenispirillum salinarum AK4]|uniref:ABC transporter n=1 Tax=Caenispirillum salinarum AK4 TaxID=1238182 RepID=K9GZA6_9PROT|nr:ABC transporter ATP-binding protein [Caenispirillum salinarum]EKV30094.1 ABC transporter [Caenispirillum salinarum AK4]
MTEGLHIADIVAGYGRRRVIDGLTLPPVPPGTVVGLIGANGSGKSTLLKTLAGLIGGTGHTRLGDHDLRRLSPALRARLVGYLPQTVMRPSSLAVYEVLLSALRATWPELTRARADQRIEAVLADMAVTDLAMRPLGALSGGQRQMIGLAQVLVRAPRLMLLDEPTSALDLRWQLSVLERVRGEARDRRAIALVAIHDINLALRFCDRVVVLGEGLIAAGPPAEALTPAVLRRAFGVTARIETCSHGRPIVVTDGVAAGAIRDQEDIP